MAFAYVYTPLWGYSFIGPMGYLMDQVTGYGFYPFTVRAFGEGILGSNHWSNSWLFMQLLLHRKLKMLHRIILTLSEVDRADRWKTGKPLDFATSLPRFLNKRLLRHLQEFFPQSTGNVSQDAASLPSPSVKKRVKMLTAALVGTCHLSATLARSKWCALSQGCAVLSKCSSIIACSKNSILFIGERYKELYE